MAASRRLAVERRRQAHRQLERRVAAAARCRRWRSAGNPSAPMTDSAGRQVRLSSASPRRSPSACVAPANGYLRTTLSPMIAAVACACSTRAGGIARVERVGQHATGRGVLEAIEQRRAMRNDDGTTPLASPECTPSVSTSTLSVPPTPGRAATSSSTAARSRRSPSRGRRRDRRRQAAAPAARGTPAGRSCRSPRRSR